MVEGGILLTETDMGSKGRAKQATQRYPPELTRDLRLKIFLWWEKVKETAKAIVPVDTGTLRATIRIQPSIVSGFGPFFEIAITPQNIFIDSSIAAGGLLINPKTGRLCDYSLFVHEGHFTKGGTWVPPRPFLQEAVDIHIDELYQIINSSANKIDSTVWRGS